MRNVNILGVHWKIRFFRGTGTFTKSQYKGVGGAGEGLPKNGGLDSLQI